MKKRTVRQSKGGPEIYLWRHPGDKLLERGADELSDAEVLSIIIGTGIKGKPSEKIAEEILAKYGSYKGMANQPLNKFLEIKGLGDVKIIRIAAAFEIAKRCVNLVPSKNSKKIRYYEKKFSGIRILISLLIL